MLSPIDLHREALMAGPNTKVPDTHTRSSSNGRQCPTIPGNERPLITHRIGSEVCFQRQREYYHKCHRCVFRGQPADYSYSPEDSSAPAIGANGAVRRKT